MGPSEIGISLYERRVFRRMKKLPFFIASFLPFAAIAAKSDTIQTLLGKISAKIIFPFVNFLLVLATLVFLWGVIQYVIAGDSADKSQKAKQQIVWGLIGLTVMASAWAIVDVIENSIFGL